ncbi:membrane protein [Lysobacter helvus]|uniref:Membrane protein n=2 Tax=Lysobacteraceae TaxID=32033 RepID=A0ABN6FYU1_9GAMM|nr:MULTISPECIES: restriction endonuclease [Lysobacter]BCT93711.1 membrane protein [Lysobacter caseinilyticus]BCT96867.1 membrane protein [Lysobacter helvus]
MFEAPTLLLALVVAIALGTLGTLYFWTIRRRQDEAETGVRALSAMRWREFSHFVLDAMRHRGYDVLTFEDEADRGQQTEFLLMRDNERTLLSAKHGSAYRLTQQTVAEFVAAMKFQGARHGLLVTGGNVDPDARKPAQQNSIELIDGGKLWPEIRPLLPASLTDEVRGEAAHRARRQVTLAWMGALVAGLAVAVFYGNSRTHESVAEATPLAATPASVMEAPAVSAAAVATASPIGVTLPEDNVASTPAEEERQRVEVARIVSTLPGIERAEWTTKSTLMVHVDETSTERFDEVCTVLTRFANLRTSRVHLQPPEGSTQQVRFKQCATF